MENPHRTASRNRVGTFSLVISAVGFCVLEAGRLLADCDGPVWTVARRGFEAAVIGGLADCFAVRALFRAIPPKPLPALPHTNLVVANRPKLTDGLVDLVEHQLLSPATLKERLGRFSASRLIIAKLEAEGGRSAAVNALLAIAERVAGDVADDEKLRAVVADAFRAQLREADLAVVGGTWLLRQVDAGHARRVWMRVAGALADEADAGAFDAVLADALAAVMASVREENAWRGMAATWFISPKHDLRHLRTALATLLRDQASDADHAWNQQLDAAVTRLAYRLIAREPDTVSQLDQLQQHLAATLDFDSLVTLLAADLRLALQHAQQAPAEDARHRVGEFVTRTVVRLKADEAAQERIDAWVRRSLQELAARYHRVIGTTARESIDSLSDETLVTELESKVGQDLQFIRLNGAVIGGSVGVALATARLFVQ